MVYSNNNIRNESSLLSLLLEDFVYDAVCCAAQRPERENVAQSQWDFNHYSFRHLSVDAAC